MTSTEMEPPMNANQAVKLLDAAAHEALEGREEAAVFRQNLAQIVAIVSIAELVPVLVETMHALVAHVGDVREELTRLVNSVEGLEDANKSTILRESPK
jgi:hypothetical protein